MSEKLKEHIVDKVSQEVDVRLSVRSGELWQGLIREITLFSKLHGVLRAQHIDLAATQQSQAPQIKNEIATSYRGTKQGSDVFLLYARNRLCALPSVSYVYPWHGIMRVREWCPSFCAAR